MQIHLGQIVVMKKSIPAEATVGKLFAWAQMSSWYAKPASAPSCWIAVSLKKRVKSLEPEGD